MYDYGHLSIRGGQSLSGDVSKSMDLLMKVEASPSIGVTPRELKKDRDYESSDLYARAHHIIYGSKGPLGPDGRVRIALVINGDESMIVENRVKNQIYKQVRDKFPRDTFAVMKGIDVNTFLLERAEDESYDIRKGRTGTIDTETGNVMADGKKETREVAMSGGRQQNDVDGMPIGHKPRGLADMRLADYIEAGRKFDYDYVFVLTMTIGERTIYNRSLFPLLPISSHTSEQNIWMRARFVDVKKGHYIYRNDLTAKGETHNGHFNGRIYERSVKVAMQEIMDDIMINE